MLVVIVTSCRKVKVKSFCDDNQILQESKSKSVSGDHCKLLGRQGGDSIGPHLPRL